MPLVPFESLPDDSRVWVFAADPPLQDAGAEQLLDDVERFASTFAWMMPRIAEPWMATV